jgi:Spy/CpxP family protein refolding chaperone
MRTGILLTISALVFSGATAFAQSASNSCQAEERNLQREKVLLQEKAIAQQEVERAQENLAQCQERIAQGQARQAEVQAKMAEFEALAAQEKAREAKLDELGKHYTDKHPEVVAVQRDLAALRAKEAALLPGLPDRWWKNQATAQSLGLTSDQQKKMDDTFQQYRLKLIDLNAALEKEEVTLEPLMAAQPLDESKTAAQIDRVAQARAELEKANGRMLLGIRKQLTADQWSKLNQSFSGDSPLVKR